MISIALMFTVLVAGILVAHFILKDSFSWPAVGLAIAVSLVVITSGYFIGIHAKAADTQILSGKVVSKSRDIVPCQHSYQCHCHNVCSGSGSNKSCSQQCDTCYEHDFDVDWDVHTTVGSMSIARIDRQGLVQPERWSEVQKDDPASVAASYQNYVKAVPDSLYHKHFDDKSVPEYPDGIYDYYKVDRVVDFDLGIPKSDLKAMSDEISDDLRDVAAAKQVNIVVVLTKNPDRMFAENLKSAWLGGKKNDLVIVLASSHYPDILWDDVFSWSKDDLVNVSVKNSIQEYGKIDKHDIEIAIDGIQKHWLRKRMHEYEYLKDEIEPTTTAYIIIFVVGLLAAFGSAFVFSKYKNQY